MKIEVFSMDVHSALLSFNVFRFFYNVSLRLGISISLLDQRYRFLSQVRDIALASVSTMYRLVWNCSDSLELFRQFDIVWFFILFAFVQFLLFCEKTNIQHVISTLRKSYFHQQFVLSSTVRTNTLRLCFLKDSHHHTLQSSNKGNGKHLKKMNIYFSRL